MHGDGHGAEGGIGAMSGPMWMPDSAPDWGRLFDFHPQPVPLVPILALIGLVAYLAGIRAVRRRGDSWPLVRTAMWSSGILTTWLVTATGIEGYGMMLLSAHMAQHMVLTMVVPILLLAGAPVTLLLRAVPSRGKGRAVRRGVLVVLHSRIFRFLSSTPFRWFFFLFGLYGIYLTGIFDSLMSNVWGHNLMLVHFVVTGLVFFGPLVDADPWPQRSGPVIRLIEALISAPFHAFFGIYFMVAATPVVRFFTDPPPSWGIDVMEDQNLAGSITWATSELPTLLLGGVILFQWYRSEQRAAVRYDRHADRDHDAELKAYNAWLARLNEPSPSAPVRH